jgi:hypothetical protein
VFTTEIMGRPCEPFLYVVSRILLVWTGEVQLQRSDEGRVELDALTTCKIFRRVSKVRR